MTEKTKKTPEVNKDFEYEVKQLIDNCETLTGYKIEVAIGALSGVNKEKMSKKEFEDRINKFLKTRIKEAK